MKSGKGSARLLTAITLAAALAGCGGGDSPTRPPVVIVTPEPVRATLAQTAFSNFQSGVWVSLELILTQKGVLDITVDWTFPDTWMYVYLSRTNCTWVQLADQTCPFLLASETKNPKPRVLVTSSLDPGTYYLVLYNVPRVPHTPVGSDNTETVALQLGLTVYPSVQGSPGLSIGHRQIVGPTQ